MTLAPGWLRVIANINPLKHIVDATRSLFRGQLATGTVGLGLLIGAALITLGVWFGGLTFARAVRQALNVNLGFDTQHVARVTIDPALVRYSRNHAG